MVRANIGEKALIIDFHSHIIPGIDDGSRDVETSLEMLRRSAGQGVGTMVATSHFYAARDRVEDFLDRRQRAWESLAAQMTEDLPRVVLGAEVAFFRGIEGAAQIDALRIQGTNAMLLEMPFRPWTQEDVDAVDALINRRGFDIILAHIERYLPMRDNRRYVDQLLEMPLRVQINAESLADWRQRGKLIRMYKDGHAHLLGSDCHGLHRRPPNLNLGREALERKLGKAFLDEMDRAGEQILLG